MSKASPSLISEIYSIFFMQGFEDALSSLLKDVKSIENEHFRMEEKFNRFVKILTMKSIARM